MWSSSKEDLISSSTAYWVGLRGQWLDQGTPNLPFRGHLYQRWLGDPKMFLGQCGDIICPPSPGSSPKDLPCWPFLENLPGSDQESPFPPIHLSRYLYHRPHVHWSLSIGLWRHLQESQARPHPGSPKKLNTLNSYLVHTQRQVWDLQSQLGIYNSQTMQ